MARVELAKPFGHWSLNPARLPVVFATFADSVFKEVPMARLERARAAAQSILSGSCLPIPSTPACPKEGVEPSRA